MDWVTFLALVVAGVLLCFGILLLAFGIIMVLFNKFDK